MRDHRPWPGRIAELLNSGAGRQVRREWLPPRYPFALHLEAMIRLFIAPLGTKEQIIVTLEQLRADAQDMLRFGCAVKQQCLKGRAVLQNKVYIRALAVDLFVSPLRRIDSWAEGTLAEIKERGPLS